MRRQIDKALSATASSAGEAQAEAHTTVDASQGARRRDLLRAAAGTVSASLLGSIFAGSARAQTTPPAPGVNRTRTGLNILFVFTDQERYHARWPKGLSLPAHERLQRTGVTFTNHQCPATMCTSSRSGDSHGVTDTR